MPWIYEQDPRRKHKRHWDKDKAGFITESGGEFVGKCPTNISVEQAEQLLNDPEAISVFPQRWTKEYPKTILNVHAGVLYRATWTIPGRSCHGFPEHPERAKRLPKSVKKKILELAERRGCKEDIQRCLLGQNPIS